MNFNDSLAAVLKAIRKNYLLIALLNPTKPLNHIWTQMSSNFHFESNTLIVVFDQDSYIQASGL